jgi:hypothetical protein
VRCSALLPALDILSKCQTKLKKHARYKRSSLFRPEAIDEEEKKFYNVDTKQKLNFMMI